MKILFAPMASSSLAHMTRLFAIADELKARGHEILFTSTHDRKKFINKSGYPTYKRTYLPVNFNDPKDQSLNYMVDYKKNFQDWFDTEIEAALSFKANLIITSPGFLGPHVTYKTGIPTVAILNAPYLSDSTGILGLSLAKKTLKNKILNSIISPLFEKKFVSQYLTHVLDLYRELEIDFTCKNRDELHHGMDIIIPSVFELEPTKHKEKYYYSGPLFWQGFENIDFDIDRLKKFKGKDKLLYLSFGGSIFNLDFYNHILELIGKTPYKYVVSTGNNFPIKDFKYNSKNTILYDFVPGLKVAALSDLLINTGSHGTLMQGLKYAKPIITIPCNIDQSYFAFRVEELGLGLNINKTNILNFSKRESYYKLNKNLDKLLLKGIQEVLSKPKYKRNALKFSIMMKKYGNAAKNIANYIEAAYGD